MVYSDFAIERLQERLYTLALKDSTPKKYSGPMFEAYEVIRQLKRRLPEPPKEANDEPDAPLL